MLMNTSKYSAGWCHVSLRFNWSSAGALHFTQRLGKSACLVITRTALFRQIASRLCVAGGKYGCGCGIMETPSGIWAGVWCTWKPRGKGRDQLAKPSCRKAGKRVKKKLRRAVEHASQI